VEKLLRLPAVAEDAAGSPHSQVAAALRNVITAIRSAILAGTITEDTLQERLVDAEIARRFREELLRLVRSSYRRAINATGIILHTGLGRAVLAPEALAAAAGNLQGYSLLEVDPETGERNQREVHVAALLKELTGAEAATAVNNNAGATLLILSALARGKEVVISRGQLVEIGGSFRVPDILKESGARLVEVGTTNRTYADDYRRAIGPDTGLLLQVHTSNYEIQGFAHHTPLEELVALGKEHGLPVVSDLGSGCFVDLSRHGFHPEPLVADRVRAGADLVCFSGD
jgi:L-seryl-tRNA(Ser) seleniumtransferase